MIRTILVRCFFDPVHSDGIEVMESSNGKPEVPSFDVHRRI